MEELAVCMQNAGWTWSTKLRI